MDGNYRLPLYFEGFYNFQFIIFQMGLNFQKEVIGYLQVGKMSIGQKKVNKKRVIQWILRFSCCSVRSFYILY